MKLRSARSQECKILTDIAHAAKRYWGYPEEWIREWGEELTISPAYVESNTVVVAVEDRIVGFHALVRTEGCLELGHLWVIPERIGGGVGKALFTDAVERGRESGESELRILSDPNAETFYQRMGAQRIGAEAAPVCGHERQLPLMIFQLYEVSRKGQGRVRTRKT